MENKACHVELRALDGCSWDVVCVLGSGTVELNRLARHKLAAAAAAVAFAYVARDQNHGERQVVRQATHEWCRTQRTNKNTSPREEPT